MSGRRLVALVATLGVLTALLGGCGPKPHRLLSPSTAPSPSIRTLTALPAPPTPPATGRLLADMRQSSRDVALGRMQVWLTNDTLADLDPISLSYRDPRLGTPLPGTRLRTVPARVELGFPLVLPRRPDCDATAGAGSGRLLVQGPHGTRRVRVSDETDVVGRYVDARCLELAVAAVAHLSWDEEVPVRGTGEDAVGTLRLRIAPTGRVGVGLHLLTVGGTPLLTPEHGAVWHLDTAVHGTGRERVLDLPVIPSRCDDHVFMESGGATTFRLRLRLTSPGESARVRDLLLPMPPAGASAAITYARDACGLG